MRREHLSDAVTTNLHDSLVGVHAENSCRGLDKIDWPVGCHISTMNSTPKRCDSCCPGFGKRLIKPYSLWRHLPSQTIPPISWLGGLQNDLIDLKYSTNVIPNTVPSSIQYATKHVVIFYTICDIECMLPNHIYCNMLCTSGIHYGTKDLVPQLCSSNCTKYGT